MAQYEAQGIELAKQAEKKLKGGIMSSVLGIKKYDEASELYSKAITQFKLAKAWPLVAKTYLKLAEINKKNDGEHDAATNYVDAAKAYVNNKQPVEAQQCFQQAVKTYTDMGRLSQAARYLKELGDTYEKEGNAEQAVAVYTQAIDLFVAENQASEANKCRLKVAQFKAESQEYEESVQCFETVAAACVESNLLKFGAKEHLLNALIVRLCYQQPDEIREANERYEDIDISFGNTRQQKLATDILASLENSDEQTFTMAVTEYDRLSKLENWRTTMLLRIKKRVEGGDEGGEDDEDFT